RDLHSFPTRRSSDLERDHRRAGAVGAEAGKRLGMLAFEKGGDREQLGRGHDALAAAAVNPHLEHAHTPWGRRSAPAVLRLCAGTPVASTLEQPPGGAPLM